MFVAWMCDIYMLYNLVSRRLLESTWNHNLISTVALLHFHLTSSWDFWRDHWPASMGVLLHRVASNCKLGQVPHFISDGILHACQFMETRPSIHFFMSVSIQRMTAQGQYTFMYCIGAQSSPALLSKTKVEASTPIKISRRLLILGDKISSD